MQNSIKLKNLTYKYDPRKTDGINDLSIELPVGKVSSIIGPSGSGKSTTLKCIAGLIPNFDGEISLPEEMAISYLDQSESLSDNQADVFTYLNQYLSNTIDSPEQRENQIRTMLLELELTNEIHSKVSDLSGGQQQRVFLAKALVTNPTLLLLDEPFANLDPILREQFLKELFQLLDHKEITVILVTHSVSEALQYSENIILLNFGELQQQGTPKELYFSPKNLFTANFIGHLNILTCKYQHVENRTYKLSLFGQEVYCQSDNNLKPEGNLFIGIYQNDIELSKVPTSLRARVNTCSFLGPYQKINVNIQNQQLDITISNKYVIKPNENVFLNFKPDNFVIIGQA